MLIKEQLLTSGQYNVQKTSNKLFVWGLGTSGQVGSVLYLFSLAQLSAGNSHAVALTSDNRVLAWGLNSSGQLGDGTTINKSFPQQIGLKGGWKKVSAGNSFTVAVRGDGTLYAWGLNTSGQLGIGVTTDRSSPSQAGIGVNWNNIDAGGDHVLATTTTALLYAWGLNNAGQMGEGNTVNRSTPAQIFSITDTSANSNLITKYSSTYSTTVVPITGSLSGYFDGSSLVTAPDSAIFEMAAGDFTVEAFFYATVFNSFNTIIHKGAVGVFAPYYFLVNISGGVLFYSSSTGSSWDIANALNFGTVALNTWNHIAVSRTSSDLRLFLNGVLQTTINVGVLSLTDNNRAVGIGCRSDGTEGFTGYISNVRIVKGVGVYTGNFTVPTSVLTATQSAGTNIQAITGSDTSLLLYTTLASTVSQNSFTQLSAGLSYSAAIDTTSKLYTWGLNASGQLGLTNINSPNGDTINRSSPVQLGTSSWQLVSAGQGHTAAILDNSTLWTWGLNTSFQLGLTDTGASGNSINRSAPVRVTSGSGSGSWKNVSAGNAFTLAIANDLAGATDNLLFTWGRNQEGQTGFVNSTTLRSTPQQITTGSWALISAGGSFSVATNDTKLLYAWGAGAGGTSAYGTTINRSSPVLVSFTSTVSQSSPIQIGASSWSIVSGGNNFFVALRSDNLLFAWGLNSSGQLGDNSSINKSSPVQIGTSSWIAISATGGGGAANAVLAISTDNKLWGWGTNNIGLKINTTSWIQVTTGQEHSVALRSDNTVWCWGIGSYGSLGNNSTITRSSPVQAGSANNWTMVTTTQNQSSGAINSLGELYMWGNNQTGDLGINATTNRSNPTVVPYNLLSWTFVAGTGAITNDGKLWKWGVNSTGAIGNNTTINRSSPVHVGVGTSFTFVTGHLAFTGAIDTTGRLWTWGQNTSGSLGVNDAINRSRPVLVSQPVSIQSVSWSIVAATDPHMLGLTTTGLLYAWGLNTSGQLGDGTAITKSTPVQIGSSSWAAIGIMASASMAVDINGALFTWGAGANNRLGDGATINKSSPTQIFGGGNFGYSTNGFRIITSSRAGSGRAFVVRADGAIFGWGDGAQGALGNNTATSVNSPVLVTNVLTSTSSPVLISESTSWTQVSLGLSSAAAINNLGELYTWGAQNGFGQLGNNSTLNTLSPFKVGSSSWTQVSAGAQHVMAITVDNKLFGWGNNSNYQLGDNTNVTKSSPIQIGTSYAEIAISSWIQVSAGLAYTLAIDSNYKLYGWGQNTAGQIGVVTESFNWTQLDAGAAFSGAIRQDNTLWFWGTNTSGNLGTQDTLAKSSPVQIGTSSWTQVSVTKNLTSAAAAIRSDSALFMWGNNSAGQLGDITTINKSSPVQIGSSSWSQVSVGDSHTLAIDAVGRLFGWGLATALNSSTAPFSWTVVSENTSHVVAVRSDGLLFTWGLNSSGQLGDSTTINRSSPTQIGTSSWTTANAGDDHTLAITSDYRLFAWGGNATNQLGDNTTVNKSSPVQVVNPAVSWTSVTAANSFSMGITSTNSLYVWGLGTSGQLGTLTEIFSWNSISAGSSNSLAIRNNNRLYAWGLNTGYQLGDGSSVTKSSPVQVAGTLSWNSVSAGVNHTLGITNTGALYGWGVATTGATGNYGEVYSWNMVASAGNNSFFIRSDGSLWATGPNTNGFLGLNDTFERSSPVQVGTSSWTFISAGEGAVLGITADYKLFSWGDNSGGQLGDGTTINKSSPVQIGIGFSWIQAAAAGSQSLAIRNDYTLWSFGYNFQGRLGLNDIVNRSNPTQVGTSSWIAVAAGAASMAIRSDNTLWTWGLSQFGQLGIGVTTNRSSPVQVTTPGTGPWLAIAAHEDYSLAVSGPGLGTPYSVYFIGGVNIYGQAGLNSTSSSFSLPTLTKAGAAGSSFIQVSTNATNNQYYSNQALTSDGKIWAWGYNAQGQLGDGTSLAGNGGRSSPVLVSGSTSWSQLSKQNGSEISFGISNDGKLYGWAYAPYYATYNAAPVAVSNPIQIGGNIRWGNYNSPIYAINSEAGQGSWTSVAAGNSFSLGIKNDNLYGWGQNVYGETGTNLTTNPIYSPTQIGTSSWSVVSASELGNFAGGIRSDNKLFMWGLGLAQTALTESSVEPQWNQISIGLSHAIALRSDGTLWAWGGNAGGQLGDGTTINQSSPVQIGTSSWIQVATGYGSSYAIKRDGTLWSWGINDSGTLGISPLTGNRSSPTQIGTSSWALVAAGYYSAYGILPNGQLYSWGDNGIGQLATNDLVLRSSPTLISGGGTYRYVHSSGRLVAGIRTDNTLWMWGYGASGGIGTGTVAAQATPQQVTTGSSTWTKVVVFGTIGASEQLITGVAGITTVGTLYTWGASANGAAAAYRGQITVPTITLFGTTTSFTNITSGIAGAVFATDTSSNLWTWGANDFGQLSDGSTINKSSPVILSSALGTSWRLLNNMSNAYNGSLINSNLEMFIWGNNATGQLGLGDTINRSSPVQLAGSWVQTNNIYTLSFLSPILATTTSSPVQIGNSSWTQLSTGTSHSLAIRVDGTLWSWGINANSVLGFNDTVTRSSPTQIGTSSWTSVSAGFNHSMAIRSDNTLWGWGSNTFGQVGAYSAPYSWTSLAVRGQSSIAIRTDGSLWVWGVNSSGQLGLGDTINRSSPTLLDAGSWNFATCGYFSAAAIKSDGTLWTWGLNAQGMLGHGDNVAKSSPVQVAGGGSWTQVACANYYTTALKTDGTAFSMGWNQNGNLGTNNAISYNSPTAVAGGLSFAQLAVLQGSLQGNSNGQTYALTPAGILYTWGANINGLAGIGDNNARSAPTLLSSPWNVTVWNKIFTGELNVFAIRNDGALYAWGGPRLELLGINSAGSAYVTSPIAVNAGFSYVSVASGRADAPGTVVAIRSDGSLYTWGWNTTGSQWNFSGIVRSSPTLLDSGSWTSVDGSVLDSFIALKNGIPYSWGYNTNGELGIGDILARSSPVQIGNAPDINTLSPVQIGSSSWSQVSAGNQFTLARDINGNLYTWGQDTSGQLGF